MNKKEELIETVLKLSDTTCELLVRLFEQLLQEQNK
jgi:hypothetical protein